MRACAPTLRTAFSRPGGAHALAGGIAAVALFGCTAVGPNYSEPTLPLPGTWTRVDAVGGTSSPAPAGDLSVWWRRFGDATLTELVEQALATSPDVRAAQARLREARARRALAGAGLYPSVTASATVSRSRGSGEVGSGSTLELYNVGFDATWEPDVFGGTRRAVEGAQADLERSLAGLQDTHVSLAAEVALNYLDLRSFQTRLRIARDNLASQTETAQLTDWRAQAGLVSAIEAEQARTAVEQTRAALPTLETGIAQAGHRLAILLGRAPGSLQARLAEPAGVPAPPESVAVGIPADTLRQRPDVRAAERRLAAETARIGQATAARFPDFTLHGSIGLEALSFGALGSGHALARSLLAGVSGVLFDGGRLRHQVEIQEAVRDQAYTAYETAVLNALLDVENALAALANGSSRAVALTSAAESARNAARYATQRYASGLIDFQAVLDTQRTLLAVEDNLASARTDTASAFVRLYKALGGGWSPAVESTIPDQAAERS